MKALILFSLLFILPLNAGFTVKGLKISHVPLGGERADKDFLEIADAAMLPYGPIEVPLSASEVAKLQTHAPFSALTAQQVQDKIVNIRRAVLCAIDLLKRSDPQTAQGLDTNFRAGMICIGLAPAGYNVGAAIMNDGKEAFHLEPINLYVFPCNRLPSWDPDLFDLANTLAHEGLHGRQKVLGWRDAVPLVVAKDRQCKEIDASQGELDRATEMLRIINAIATTGKLPDDARGLYARMGADLLVAFSGDSAGLQAAIKRWRQKLNGIKLRANEVLVFRQSYKRAAELAIAGSPEAAGVLDKLRKHRLFQYYAGSNEFAPITRWYINKAPLLVEQSGQPPELVKSNRMRQLVPPLEEAEDIVVSQMDTITTGIFLDDQNFVYIGGIDFAALGGQDEGVVVRYDLDPVTKGILDGTAVECLRSTEMGGGYIMNLNQFDGKMYAVQLDDHEICELRDTNADGCPDLGVSVGYLISEGWDADNPSLSIPLSGFHFTDADTIAATHTLPGTVLHDNDPVAYSWRLPGGLFEGLPNREVIEDLERRPGFDGAVSIGSQSLSLVGSPWGVVEVFDDTTSLGESCLSAHGRGHLSLGQALSEGSQLRVVDTLNLCESVITWPLVAPPDLASIFFPESPQHDRGVPIDIRYRATQDASVKYSSDLNFDLGITYELDFPNRFGQNFRHFEPEELVGGESRGFFNVSTMNRPLFTPVADSLFAHRGISDYHSLAKNDDAPPTATYHLVSPPTIGGFTALTDDAYKFYPDGTFDLSYPTFASNIQLTYRVSDGGNVSADLIATILPNMDVEVLKNPPVKGKFGDITLVRAYVLEIGGRDYPAYQFALAPKDNGCDGLHWHSPLFATVFPIGNPATAGITDPDGGACGYGKLSVLMLKKITVDKEIWDDFLDDHPCP